MHAEDPGDTAQCHLCILADDVACLTTLDNNHAPHAPRMVATRASWGPAFAGNDHEDAHTALDVLLAACDDIDARAIRQKYAHRMEDVDFKDSILRHTTPFNKIFGGLALVTTNYVQCVRASGTGV